MAMRINAFEWDGMMIQSFFRHGLAKTLVFGTTSLATLPIGDGSHAWAQTGKALSSSDAIASGEAGARAGTALYNTINPDRPLPNSGGSVVQDTVRNMGAGQSLKEAWQNAAESNAGASSQGNSTPKKDR